MTNTLINLVKQFEGCKLSAYQDATGIWTIGYGCTGGDISSDTVWTQEKADEELIKRLGMFQRGVKNLLSVSANVNQNQLDALTSFAYNLGLGVLKHSRLLRKVNEGDFDGAANDLTKWVHAGNQILPGLVKRREAEKVLFLS